MLRADLEALATEFEGRIYAPNLRRVTKDRLLLKCAADIRALLERHPEASRTLAADADEIADALDHDGKVTCRTYHSDGYVCTRAPGHAGDHLAGTWDRGDICARWSQP
jgi:hypothetical protein